MKLTARIEEDKLTIVCRSENEYEEKLLGALVADENGIKCTPVIQRDSFHFTHGIVKVLGVELTKLEKMK